ncbi:MAG TPA: RNA 3'-terminal phosphate cyclase [Xanthomonadales bacterium]
MLTIDGDMGEGGGQILRTALTLSLCQGRAFRIVNIRRRRNNPGLRAQHLAAVNAAATIGHAEVRGADLGSREIIFKPQQPAAGQYHFDIGTAGSTSLVLQTLLPPLMTASAGSRITLVGGTHNPLAPSFEYLHYVYLPLLRRMGAKVSAQMDRAGFYPAGGGSITVDIETIAQLQPLTLLQRGKLKSLSAYALLAHLPEHIAERELQVLQTELQLERSKLHTQILDSANGQGNVLLLVIESEYCNEVICGFGRRGLRAETVARQVVNDARRYLDAAVPVGQHLADQLILLLALAGSGSYRTLEPDSHTRTNIDVIRAFTEVHISCEREDIQRWRVTVD